MQGEKWEAWSFPKGFGKAYLKGSEGWFTGYMIDLCSDWLMRQQRGVTGVNFISP